MKENILIVEDEFIVANDLRLMLVKAGYTVCGIAASVEEARQMIDKSKPTWVLLDIFLQDGSMGIDLAAYLTEKNIGFIYISANTNQSVLEAAKVTQPYGFLVKPFRERDLLIMLDIAREKHQNNLQFVAQRELLLQRQLSNIVEAPIDTAERLGRIPGVFQALVPFDVLKINLMGHMDAVEYNFVRTGFDEYQGFKNQEIHASVGLNAQEAGKLRIKFPHHNVKGIYNAVEFRRMLLDDAWEKQLSTHFRLESKLTMTTTLKNGDPVVLSFFSRKNNAYSASQLGLLNKAESALQQLFAELGSDSKTRVAAPALKNNNVGNDRSAITVAKTPGKFEGIIGNSPALLRVLDNISLVAAAPVSVLILGESGTGKEHVAQCIHKLSPRKGKPIVTVNCAAMPAELIESELFGHEKGAFTGATDKRTGKFELADGGTIFLDEIGEMPLEAQVKLLRVLQEKEIEHVGGSKTIKVDVRIIAATNRNLEKEVAEGRFRLDLYYRLNVFPVELPSLRDRKADIGLLAQFFIEKYAGLMGRNVTGISTEALKQLEAYHWPGNIRELEHLIERSLIMASGATITHIVMPNAIGNQPGNVASSTPAAPREVPMKTLEQIEAEHILGVLRNCGGKVCGTGGAAEVLGLPPSTLNSKIKKLGIKRESYFN